MTFSHLVSQVLSVLISKRGVIIIGDLRIVMKILKVNIYKAHKTMAGLYYVLSICIIDIMILLSAYCVLGSIPNPFFVLYPT